MRPRCPLRVISGHRVLFAPCLLHLRKRTSPCTFMSIGRGAIGLLQPPTDAHLFRKVRDLRDKRPPACCICTTGADLIYSATSTQRGRPRQNSPESLSM